MAVASKLIDELSSEPADEPVDLIETYAMPLAARVMCRIVGIPERDMVKVRQWSLRLNAESTPANDFGVAEEADGYLKYQCEMKLTSRRQDVAGGLLSAYENETVSHQEVRALIFLLLMAGHESTANFVANCVLLLSDRADLWSMLRSGRTTDIQRLLGELFRFEAPLEFATPRYASTDFRHDGTKFRRGDLIFVGLSAANHDPTHFQRPSIIDCGRSPLLRPLTFGAGRHSCPGYTIGRIVSEVALVSLASQFPYLTVACPTSELRWWPSMVMRGMLRLPVRCGERLPSVMF
ncbi:cytochrome P450 [Mycolicibacterium sp. S3B2]|uniref:cytochrome P450 n=1 Tax=Mycolicibacterium sp. S3B2 TaxID=3415120 RepID=UPI003C7D52B9